MFETNMFYNLFSKKLQKMSQTTETTFDINEIHTLVDNHFGVPSKFGISF